mmetsp:Transcript_66763/g.180496  ORF Transcript_66763/g.180496 Transcript_66763/m.180496 type:complete len:162 (+) Transcript_66763:72-557(+)
MSEAPEAAGPVRCSAVLAAAGCAWVLCLRVAGSHGEGSVVVRIDDVACVAAMALSLATFAASSRGHFEVLALGYLLVGCVQVICAGLLGMLFVAAMLASMDGIGSDWRGENSTGSLLSFLSVSGMLALTSACAAGCICAAAHQAEVAKRALEPADLEGDGA